MSINPIGHDMAAMHGDTVTQAHVDYCATNGHGTHTVDGRDTGTCPRCGEVTERRPTFARAIAGTSLTEYLNVVTGEYTEPPDADSYDALYDAYTERYGAPL